MTVESFPSKEFAALDEALAHVESAANAFEDAMKKFDPNYAFPQELSTDQNFGNAYFVLSHLADKYGHTNR